ncbi:MAG: phage tail protein [Clostridia bacterium]|nr:phage tail protein [Clostridia bacterium]
MAGVFKEAALTAKGIALLAKAQAGQCTIGLTKAAAGAGEYGDDDELLQLTALKDQRQEFELINVTTQNETNVYVKFIMSNQQDSGNLASGYYVKEIGIFADDPDEGEILYAVAVAETDQWDYMPAYNDLLPATITVEFLIEVANASEVTITSNGIAYAPADEFYELEEDVEELHAQATDAQLAAQVLAQRMSTLEDGMPERGTVTLTNTREFPLFNSTVLAPETVAIENTRYSTGYQVNAQIVDHDGGTAGEVEISDMLVNGFKIGFTGTATSATVAYEVVGGMEP